jgi:hypothetical protein
MATNTTGWAYLSQMDTQLRLIVAGILGGCVDEVGTG